MNDSEDKLSKEVGRTCACFNLRRAARLVTQRFDQAFRELGLRATQLSVLVAVYDMPELTVSKAARVLGMDRTSLTRNIQLLERKGLVLVTEGDDKRVRKIDLTPEGVEVLKAAFPLWRKAQSEVELALGNEKWGALLSGLHEVARKLR